MGTHTASWPGSSLLICTSSLAGMTEATEIASLFLSWLHCASNLKRYLFVRTLIRCPHEKARKVFRANSSRWFLVMTWKSTKVVCLAQGPNAIELAVLQWQFKVFAVHFFTFKAGSAESLITLRLPHYQCLLISLRLYAVIVQGCSNGVM